MQVTQQLSSDVVQLLINDPALSLLMSLVCRGFSIHHGLDDSLKDLMVKYFDYRVVGRLGAADFVDRIVAVGRIDLLEQYVADGGELPPDICELAACAGNLEIMKWCRKRGYSWDFWSCVYAARGGHLTLLQWCRRKGCPWNEVVCQCTASRGQLAALQWCVDNGAPWSRSLCERLARLNGHSAVVDWIRTYRA
jgi:hypothetical protein